jgi:hypothetical protein
MANALQRQHEVAVCNRLLKTLDVSATFVRLGDDHSEPDVIYSHGKGTLGIEVATAYYDDEYAKWGWSLARNMVERRKIGIWNPDEKIHARIQLEIFDKCSRTYSAADKIWLCVARQAPLSGESEVVKRSVERLTIPQPHGFDRIFLHYQATDENGEWKSITLQTKRSGDTAVDADSTMNSAQTSHCRSFSGFSKLTSCLFDL